MSPPIRLGTADPAPPPGTSGSVAGLGQRVRSVAMGENVDMTAPQYLVHGNTILAEHVRQRLLSYGAQLHTLGVLAGVLGSPTEQKEYRDAVANAVGTYFEGLLDRSQRRAWYESVGVLDAASIGLGYWYKLSGVAADVVGADGVAQDWHNIGDTLIETDPERFLANATGDFLKSLADSCKKRWDLFWADLDEHGLYVAYGRVQIDGAFLAAELAIDVVIGIATGGAAAAASVGLKIVGRRVSATVTRITIRAANRAARGVPDSGILKVVNRADDQIDPAIKRAVLDEDLLGTASRRDDMARRGEQPDPDVEEPSGGGGNRNSEDPPNNDADRSNTTVHPLEAETAQRLNEEFPEADIRTNVDFPAQDGFENGEIDVMIDGIPIEVNAGKGTGKLAQVRKIANATGSSPILFSTKMGGSVERSFREAGFDAVRSMDKLVELIRKRRDVTWRD